MCTSSSQTCLLIIYKKLVCVFSLITMATGGFFEHVQKFAKISMSTEKFCWHEMVLQTYSLIHSCVYPTSLSISSIYDVLIYVSVSLPLCIHIMNCFVSYGMYATCWVINKLKSRLENNISTRQGDERVLKANYDLHQIIFFWD